ADRDAAKTEQDAKVAEVFFLQAIMLNVFTQLGLAYKGLVASDLLLTVDRSSEVFRAFEKLADNTKDFGDMFNDNIRGQVLRDDVRDEDETRARIIAATAGLVLGVGDLLTTLSSLKEAPTVNQDQAALLQGERLHLAI